MLRICLFGRFKIEYEGQLWAFKGTPPTFKLLTYLLLNRQQPLARHSVAMCLWPDLPESKIRAKLRRHLFDLRGNLPSTEDWLLDKDGLLQWKPSGPYWLDVAEFEATMRKPGTPSASLALYTDHLLTDAYDDWIVPYRKQLYEQFFAAQIAQLEHYNTDGESELAIAQAQAILHFAPLHEVTVRQLMTLLYEDGNRVTALQIYQAFKQAVYIDLGVEPEAQTVALFEIIRDERSLYEPPPTNVRAAPNRYFGRTQEQTTLINQLSDPQGPRLLTITGVGGCGKTRLAREIAQQLSNSAATSYADGIFFVDLSAITQREIVLDAIVQTLGVSDRIKSRLPSALASIIKDEQLLLILDNFEQVLDAAKLISELLSYAPQLRILVTSRARLRCYGEHEYRIQPLQLPPADTKVDPLDYQSVVLFLDRVQAISPDFALTPANADDVMGICRQLDGLPLALEIAAAGLRYRSLAAMREQLQSTRIRLRHKAIDMPERHASLHTALDWSYRLLSAETQTLFAQLSLFIGSFDHRAVANIVDTDLDDDTLHDLLFELAEHSLLQHEQLEHGVRFRMLVTVREFAAELVTEEASRNIWRTRHLTHFHGWAQQAEQFWQTEEQQTWWRRAEIEDDNFRAALVFGLSSIHVPIIQQALSLYKYLYYYWTHRKPVPEVMYWLEQMQAQMMHLDATSQIDLLRQLAFEENRHGRDKSKMYGWLESACELARSPSVPPKYLAASLMSYGLVAGQMQDSRRAEQLFFDAATVARTLVENKRVLTAVLGNYGAFYITESRYAEAIEILEESLEISRSIEFDMSRGTLYYSLANALRMDGQLAASTEYLKTALAMALEQDRLHATLVCVSGAAEHCLFAKKFSKSISLHSAYKAISEQIGLVWTERTRKEFDDYMTRLRNEVTPDEFGQAWRAGAALGITEAGNYSLACISKTVH